MRPTTASVIGCGRFGPHLARNLREAGLEVRVQDRNPAQADAVATALDLYAVDLARALESELVVVATPPASHADIAMRAIRCGAHVLVEKPMTLSHPIALELVAAAEDSGRVLAVDHTALFEPGVRAFLEAIPRLGRLQRIRCIRHTRQPGRHTDALWDLAPHDLAVLDPFLDERLHGVHQRRAGRICRSRLRTETVEIDVGWGLEPNRSMEAWGEHGHLSWNGSTLQLAGERLPVGRVEPLAAMVADVLDAIENHRAPRSDGELGLRTVARLADLGETHQAHGNRLRSERRDT